ncbi:winged helix-turn-helix domain-containing protein [Labrenzia sp. PHM005]|uniref:winged helix-turn-helix domain-containing protein n=1 Tax=Labrenzia sp. PHM005 TaxID=2590016 RepID=UPI0011401424|nr:crosslink repair DNA glycosylase YcaQ family protein [Labrenzia sp. PHM005]QDG78116.1 winged helix-turn-helix domain-containing protein [Labrenzia sp. PHM005]
MPASSPPQISNAAARHLFLDRHGLATPLRGTTSVEDVNSTIKSLGFVQVDSINTVARAHHMILASRLPGYKESHLKRLLEKNRQLFEHWTHDASVIPADFFPHWRLRFDRDREKLIGRWRNWRQNGFEAKFNEVLQQVSDHGPVSSSTVGEGEKRSNGGWWNWHPSKTALEFLWRTGALSVCHRQGFQKIYDLTERVVLDEHRNTRFETSETIEWANRAALDRLGFATSGELAAFWDLITPAEAKTWCERKLATGEILEVLIECADGAVRKCFAAPETLDTLDNLPEPPSRVRILSPFDPALRDRKRAERLFGFHYRIEVFVPEPKRQYGYYVFPVLESDKLIGRIDMKAHRSEDRLHVKAFWPEKGTRMGKGRIAKLESEIGRMARFSGCSSVTFERDWLRTS